MYIYAVHLENQCYYIGKTDSLDRRFKEHMSTDKSSLTYWVKKYPPIGKFDVILANNAITEDGVALDYMQKYGIEKVRGGSFTSELTETEIQVIQKMISTKTNSCFTCHEIGHFAKNCDKDISKVVPIPFSSSSSSSCDSSSDDCCYRCGRIGHWANQCYASYHIDGHRLR